MTGVQTCALPISQSVLAYLDWRTEEQVAEGSRAIYFLWHPVPDVARAKMGNFLRNRVLLSFPLRGAWYPVPEGAPPPEEVDWASVWRDKSSTGLWLEGVPHGFFVPPGGLVAWRDITVLGPWPPPAPARPA